MRIASGAIGVSWVRIGPAKGMLAASLPASGGETADLAADRGPPEIGRRPEPEREHRDAAADLVGVAAEAQRDVHDGQQQARGGAGRKAEHGAAGLCGHCKSDAGAAQHLPFDAEIDDAHPLRQRFAERHHHQRCRGAQHCRDPRACDCECFRLSHSGHSSCPRGPLAPRAATNSRPCRIVALALGIFE